MKIATVELVYLMEKMFNSKIYELKFENKIIFTLSFEGDLNVIPIESYTGIFSFQLSKINLTNFKALKLTVVVMVTTDDLKHSILIIKLNCMDFLSIHVMCSIYIDAKVINSSC